MIWFIAVAFLVVVFAAVALAAKVGAFRETVYGGENKDHGPLYVKIVGGICAFLLVAVTLFMSYNQVPAGHSGLVYEFGAIVGETEDGPQFIRPWRTLRPVNMQVQAVQFSRTDDEDKIEKGLTQIAAASKETQNVFFDVTVNYSLDRGSVVKLYTEVGPSWFNKLIPTRVHQFFKAEVVEYSAVEATQRREEIRQAVTAALDEELEQFGISIESVQVDNIGYNAEFEAAIEQKQVATQDALRAEEVVKQREAEARQNVAQATGAANAAIETARGKAEAITIEANAQAAANVELARSLTPELIRYRAIDKLQDTKVAILPSGGGYLLDPSTLLQDLTAQ